MTFQCFEFLSFAKNDITSNDNFHIKKRFNKRFQYAFLIKTMPDSYRQNINIFKDTIVGFRDNKFFAKSLNELKIRPQIGFVKDFIIYVLKYTVTFLKIYIIILNFFVNFQSQVLFNLRYLLMKKSF